MTGNSASDQYVYKGVMNMQCRRPKEIVEEQSIVFTCNVLIQSEPTKQSELPNTTNRQKVTYAKATRFSDK
jgi:hypothetical protein